jgi:hypothetical protein
MTRQRKRGQISRRPPLYVKGDKSVGSPLFSFPDVEKSVYFFAIRMEASNDRSAAKVGLDGIQRAELYAKEGHA